MIENLKLFEITENNSDKKKRLNNGIRYLGNKTSILCEIKNLLHEKKLLDKDMIFFDAFCGTGSVSNYLKRNFNIKINDNLTWASIYAKGRIVAELCKFEKLGFNPIEYLNKNSRIQKEFIYNNYSPGNSNRMYFSVENAGKIDYYRFQIEKWKNENRIDESEYCYLLACLIEAVSNVANTAGVYGAFLKKWDSRALKPIELNSIIDNEEYEGRINFLKAYNSKIEDIISEVECDILYIDPPYTQNQYGTQYHLLETLILNDNPKISKITGSRPTAAMRSDWSKDIKAHIMLDKIIHETKAKYIIMSYSNNGLMSKEYIEAVFKRYGKIETYSIKKIPYKKYKNWKSSNENDNFEYLFFIEKKNESDIIYESPLNYIGSKYKILKDIKKNSPFNIKKIFDVFGGGFNVGVNFYDKEIIYNDINYFVKDIVASFYYTDTYEYIQYIKRIIKKFNLEKGNSESYTKARNYYNNLPDKKRDPKLLFTIILYGYQQQIRFNSKYEFNNPAGIRWFNDKILEKMISFSRHIKKCKVSFNSNNYLELKEKMNTGTFLYLDPPYNLTTGTYNDGKRGFKGWNSLLEKELFNFCDEVSKRKIPFMLSYVIEHKNNVNYELINWAERTKYRIIQLDSVVGISGSRRKEVLIVNYD